MDYLPGGSPHIPARGRERFLPRRWSRWIIQLLFLPAIALLLTPQPALAAGEAVDLPPFGPLEKTILVIAGVVALISVL